MHQHGKKLNVDPANFMGTTSIYDNVKPPFLHELFNEFGDSVIYVPEIKDNVSATALVDLIEYYNLQENCIVQCFTLDPLKIAIDAGIKVLALGQNVDLDKAKNMGVTYIGSDGSSGDVYLNSIISKGMKPTIYVVNKRREFNSWISKGVVGIFSDDPLYVSGLNTHVRTNDPFRFKTWYHGHAPAYRGVFLGTNRWGFNTLTSDYVLQGWGSPISFESYKINFNLRFDTLPSDTTRWSSIFVCSDTDFFSDGSAGSYGYHILFRANGQMIIYRVDNGVSTQLQSTWTTVSTEGSDIPLEISVSSSSISITRKDGTPVTISANDTTYRGKNFFFGHNNSIVSFSNVVIS
jgi:hypothetical protein